MHCLYRVCLYGVLLIYKNRRNNKEIANKSITDGIGFKMVTYFTINSFHKNLPKINNNNNTRTNAMNCDNNSAVLAEAIAEPRPPPKCSWRLNKEYAAD